MAAAGLVVQRPQQASTGCGDLQHGEVLPGNLGDLRVERLALIGHVGAYLPTGGDARQNGLLRFQIAEHGVAEMDSLLPALLLELLPERGPLEVR